MHKTFVVKGMKCLSCVKAIQERLDKVGLKNASVSLNPPEITFINNQVSKEVLQASLDAIGNYKIVSTKENELLNERERKSYAHEEGDCCKKCVTDI